MFPIRIWAGGSLASEVAEASPRVHETISGLEPEGLHQQAWWLPKLNIASFCVAMGLNQVLPRG